MARNPRRSGNPAQRSASSMVVDKAWMADFAHAMRTRGASEGQVKDHLAAVTDEVHRTRLDARARFGDPTAYADSLDLPGAVSPLRGVLALVLPVVAGVLALTVAPATAGAYRSGDRLGVTWGALAAVAVLVVAGVGMTLRATWLLRHPGRLMMLGGAAAMAAIGLGLFVRARALEVPWTVGAGVTAVLLLVSVVGLWRGTVTPGADVHGQAVPLSARVLGWTAPFVFVMLTAAFVAVRWMGS